MFSLKKIFAPILVGVALLNPAFVSATTVNEVDCGTVANGGTTTCAGGPYNLAVFDTAWFFEADAANVNPSSGTLIIETYVDPYWSLGTSVANITLKGADYGTWDLFWGQETVPLSYNNGTASALLNLIFPEGTSAEDPISLILSWSGLRGGETISLYVSAVPLPAGGLLLVSALGVLGLARRRRSTEPALA